MAKLLQYFIKAYSFLVSPFLGRNCRFTPTCSAYAHQALENHGFLKGVYLIFFRIICCHPWSKRNFDDPVPERFAWKEVLGYKRCTCIKEAELSGTENKIIEGSNNE